MKSPILSKTSNKIAVQQFKHDEQSLALLRIQGDFRSRVLKQFSRNLAIDGAYARSGGAISPGAVNALLTASGIGVSASAAFFANSLFVATANPATLMAIGNGFGSAVMGATGIIGQAAFVSAGTAIVPVVLPIVAFQAMSTAMILSELRTVSAKLEDLKRALDRVIQRSEATHIGVLISADQRLRELEEDCSCGNRFTASMTVRLAALESQVNPIFERYRFLHGQRPDLTKTKSDDLNYRQFDASLVIESSLLDLRLDVLRLKLTAQEDLVIASKARDRLLEKVERYAGIWDAIAQEPREVEAAAADIRVAAEAMHWWRRKMPGGLGGKRAQHKAQIAQADTLNNASRHGALDLLPKTADARYAAESVRAMLSEPRTPAVSLVYWRDESGEHSFYTPDFQFESATPDEIAEANRSRSWMQKLWRLAGG